MSDSSSTSSSKIHHLFCRLDSSLRNEVILNFISSIREDDCIDKLKNNQWDCLWCGITFQGINAAKALDRVIGIRGLHIKSYNASIDKAQISRYKDIQKYKAAKKTVLNDHLH